MTPLRAQLLRRTAGGNRKRPQDFVARLRLPTSSFHLGVGSANIGESVVSHSQHTDAERSNMNKPHVLIAGAGIGGIVAALALTKRGVRVSLFEQAAELHELGAGVQISPNGSRVLRELGLESAITTIAAVPKWREMRLFNTGQSWRPFRGANPNERFGAPFWLVHRGDFHQVLAAELQRLAPNAIRIGARCTSVSQDSSGVTLHLGNSEQIRGDALIGADGVHSRIRAALYEARADFTGFVAWRGVVPMGRLPARLRQESFTGWMGPAGLIVTYPIRGGQLLNFAANVERSDWTNESWSEAGTVAECLHDYEGWHPDIREVISAIDIPYKWALLARDPLSHWSTGRITLLGEAAHPLLPFLGQGANMAIEDGMVLSRCISGGNNIVDGLRRYEAARLERTSRIARVTLGSISHMHNPRLADPAQAQEFMDGLLGAKAPDTRYDWIYEYDATTATV